MNETSVHTSMRYCYSDKIKDRRRSLFPLEKGETADKSSDNSDLDLDHINPLSSSDTDCDNYGLENENISLISSTKLISDLLSTPKSKSEQAMLNVNENEKVGKYSVSPTKHHKTPNDSSVHFGAVPKLPRKCLQECSDPEELPSSPVHSKCSKVRTSLFPEFDLSIAPTQFYPKMDSPKPCSDKLVLWKHVCLRMVRGERKRTKSKKRIPGQINAGVKHRIRRPKEPKTVLKPKFSLASLERILTYKHETVATNELNGFLKELNELNKSKEIKLIERRPALNASNSLENKTIPNLKRPHTVEDGIISKRVKLNYSKDLDQDESDNLNCENLDIGCIENIDQILELLDVPLEEEKENTTVEINDHCFTETLLSPTSEMCNMASVMKIDSPKKIKNLNTIFQNMANNDNQKSDQGSEKYFPVFYPHHKPMVKSDKDIRGESSSKRKKQKVSSNQMLLDAGQKHFGVVNCAECNWVYHAGDPSDEALHQEHHNASHILHFPGWKNERIVKNLPSGGRIIQILPGDSKVWIERVKRVIEVINREMGYYDMTLDISVAKVFLLIKNKSITGCIIAENKSTGYKVLTSDVGVDMCSTEEYPIKCGVSRIWVSPQFRRKGIATELMDIVKSHFIPDRLLNNCDIALSSPTVDGKLFAAHYFRTPNFLTYFD